MNTRLGFGAYRISHQNPNHVAALRMAVLEKKISVIDTAAHFGDGSSELAIGDLLSHPKGPRREDVFLITKAGFVTAGVAQVLEKNKIPSSLIHSIAQSDVGHAISPLVVQAQLNESLRRLRTNYIDLYMINCPERLLKASMSVSQLELSLARTIEYLVSECHAGRINGFGFTSTKEEWALPRKIVASVLNSSSDASFWQGVQVPANIYETSFLKREFLHKVTESKLALFTHRMIRAITQRGIQKLSTTIDSCYSDFSSDPYGVMDTVNIMDRIQQDLTVLDMLEDEIMDRVDNLSLSNQFIWASTLRDTMNKLVGNEMAAQIFFEQKVMPQVHSDTSRLAVSANPDAHSDVQNWISQYIATLTAIKKHVCALAHYSSVLAYRQTRDSLKYYTRDWVTKNPELPDMSLGLMYGAREHVPGAVLVGMRQTQYVAQLSHITSLPNYVWNEVYSMFGRALDFLPFSSVDKDSL